MLDRAYALHGHVAINHSLSQRRIDTLAPTALLFFITRHRVSVLPSLLEKMDALIHPHHFKDRCQEAKRQNNEISVTRSIYFSDKRKILVSVHGADVMFG